MFTFKELNHGTGKYDEMVFTCGCGSVDFFILEEEYVDLYGGTNYKLECESCGQIHDFYEEK